MKKTLCATLMALSLLVTGFSASPAHAALLGSLFHDYGNDAGHVDPGGIDKLSSDYVLVSTEPANANRFSDSFNLAGLGYDSIDSFKLTLTVSNTNGWKESWRLRPGGSDTAYHLDAMRLDRVGKESTQAIFTIDGNIDSFSSMVQNGEFYYWFADQGSHLIWDNEFKLYDAKLDVYGTAAPAATPIPGAVWLLGSGLVGLVGLRKRTNG